MVAIVLVCALVWTKYENIYPLPHGFQADQIEADRINRDFYSRLEALLPEQSAVYELPFVEFPEAPNVYNMLDYAQFRGYIYTNTLRWSYGGSKGRDTKSKELYIDEGRSVDFVKGIKTAGFDAVYIDTDAYEDTGTNVLKFYEEELGLEPLASEDGKMYAFILK